MLSSLGGAFTPALAMAAEAVAAEGGHGGGGGNPLTQFSPGLVIWTILTFVALVGLLWWKAWPPIVRALKAREEAVRGAIEQARREREEAEKLLGEHRRLVADARRETGAMIDQGRREAERVRAELLEKARRDQQELVEQGRRQIEYETRAAVSELKGQVVDLALAASEKLLRRTLDAEAHRRLLEEALEEVSEEGRRKARPVQ